MVVPEKGKQVCPVTVPAYCLERVSKLQHREKEPRWRQEVSMIEREVRVWECQGS